MTFIEIKEWIKNEDNHYLCKKSEYVVYITIDINCDFLSAGDTIIYDKYKGIVYIAGV